MEVETIVKDKSSAKDKSSKTLSKTLGAIAAIVTIFVGINGLVNSEGNTHIENSNGTVIIGDNNTLVGTIINKVTSISISLSEKNSERENSKDPGISESNQDERTSGISVPGEDKVIYNGDFSLSGTIVEKPVSNTSSYTNLALEGGTKTVDIPDDEGRFYQVLVTTYPESEVEVYGYSTYNYKYKKDKFSDFVSASGEAPTNTIGNADKMKDVNETVRVGTMSESNLLNIIHYFDQPDVLETRLVSRNLSIGVKIPEAPFGGGYTGGGKIGDTVISKGHIKIVEIEKPDQPEAFNNLTLNIG